MADDHGTSKQFSKHSPRAIIVGRQGSIADLRLNWAIKEKIGVYNPIADAIRTHAHTHNARPRVRPMHA
jgi:hypothetical protein